MTYYGVYGGRTTRYDTPYSPLFKDNKRGGKSKCKGRGMASNFLSINEFIDKKNGPEQGPYEVNLGGI